MNFNKSITIVDDDPIHLDLLNMKLNKLGFNNVVSINSYDAAVVYINSNLPDLLIVDYFLDNGKTGLELLKQCVQHFEIPIIFCSSFYNREIFDEILNIYPIDFISKSAQDFEIYKSIQLAFVKFKSQNESNKINDFILVKYNKELKKLNILDIEYISVDGKYLELNSSGKKFIIRSTLNEFLKKLPNEFVKIHQSYIINLNFLSTVNSDDNYVKLTTEARLNFSRSYKKYLLAKYFIP